MHTALTVREEEFFPNYRRMWEGLPEGKGPKETLKIRATKKTLSGPDEVYTAAVGYHK